MQIQRALRLTRSFMLATALALLPSWATVARAQSPTTPTRSKYVILVMTDGFRWQELFNGADQALLSGGRTKDGTTLRNSFDRETPTERREALMPFVWGTIAAQGQILGDSAAGSVSRLTNGMKFSYPGYNEALTGHADARIDSNRHGRNANRSVFEWLNAQKSLNGRVAAFGGWSAFPRIFNTKHSKVPVYDGATAVLEPTQAVKQSLTERIIGTLRKYLPSSTSDASVRKAVAAYGKKAPTPPRVLFVGFNETDHWAHSGHYDRYLQSAHRVDAFLAEIWANAQSNPATRDSTTLIVTTDHGRGEGTGWFTHGRRVNGADRIWIAAIGPDISALGVRQGTPSTQSQVAATVAAALGLDWQAAEPRAASALPVFDAPDGARDSTPARPSPVPSTDRSPATARRQ